MMEKRHHFNKSCWGNWIFTCRKLKLAPYLSLYTNINSKWIKHLNIRSKTLKVVQKREVNTLEAIGIGNCFLSRTEMSQQLREKIDKWNYRKILKLLHNKRNGS
jgi:hypothetical protein